MQTMQKQGFMFVYVLLYALVDLYVLCSALSMQTKLTKQNNIKLYMQQSKTLIHLQSYTQ